MAYDRILLKLTGEALGGSDGRGIDYDRARSMCEEIARSALDKRVMIVVGGGNLMRGKDARRHGVGQVDADHMGMLATVINGKAIKSILESVIEEHGMSGLQVRLMSAISMNPLAEPFIQGRAERHLEKRRIVIFAGGIGNPTFTSDTAAALRGVEMRADVVLKATNVEGVYDQDPKNPEAKLYRRVSMRHCVEHRLNVMDMTAFTTCRENDLKIHVFCIKERGNIRRAIMGEDIGTLVVPDDIAPEWR